VVYSPLGPVAVEVVEDLRDDGQVICGDYNIGTRCIRVRAGMHPATMWQTFYHEVCHMFLTDAGVKLSKEQEEAVCDAYGSYRTAELLDQG
jgi:hypothetical protein